MSSSGVYRFGGAFLPAQRLLVLAIALGLIAALLVFVQYTRPGRAMRALAQDREATLLMGVDVDRISMLGFGLGAGSPASPARFSSRSRASIRGIGSTITTKAFIMIMIGGAGVVAGSIVGAVLLGFAEAIGYALLPGSITYLLIFLALILFLILRPQGLMGKPWG